jgi:2-hydroxy-6-oxonona-2,4-dienedioate hydrolase
MTTAPDVQRASAIHVRSFGRGPAVILLHGGMGSSTHWQRNIDALASTFCVHAVDLPGFGEAADVPKDIGADDYLALVRRSIAPLIDSAGDVALVGFSFGGAVAAHLARRMSNKVARLVLIGPGGFGDLSRQEFDLRSLPPTGAEDPAYRAVIRHNLLAMMLHEPTSVDDATIDLQCANIARTRFVSWKVGRRSSLIGDLAATSAFGCGADRIMPRCAAEP